MFSLLEKEMKSSSMNGVGLSGVQIGFLKRIAIIRTDKVSLNLFNSVIKTGSGSKITREGCLSLPNQWVNVERKEKITLVNGDKEIYELDGFEAIVVQHEIDHWNGILILDRRI